MKMVKKLGNCEKQAIYSFPGSHFKSFQLERWGKQSLEIFSCFPEFIPLSSENYPNFPLGIQIFTIEPINILRNRCLLVLGVGLMWLKPKIIP